MPFPVCCHCPPGAATRGAVAAAENAVAAFTVLSASLSVSRTSWLTAAGAASGQYKNERQPAR